MRPGADRKFVFLLFKKRGTAGVKTRRPRFAPTRSQPFRALQDSVPFFRGVLSLAGANSVPRSLRTLAWRGSVAGFARSARSHARPAALWLPFMPSVVGSATIPRITSTANSALTTASSLSCRFPKSSFQVQLRGAVLHALDERGPDRGSLSTGVQVADEQFSSYGFPSSGAE